MSMRRLLLLTALSFTSLAAYADAAVIAKWDFEDQDLIVDQGSGTLTPGDFNLLYTAAPTGDSEPLQGQVLSVTNRRSGNGSTTPYQWWSNGESLIFQISTVGYESLVLSFDTRRINQGFGLNANNSLSYSTDGSTYSSAGIQPGAAYDLPRNNISYSFSFDFSQIEALNDQETVYIRITLDGAQNGNNNERNYFDNVVFSAAPVPEPTSLGLIALAGVVGLRRRRA